MGETIPLGDDVFYRSFTCPRKKDTYQLRVDDQAIAYYSETHKMWLRTTVIAVDEDGWIQAHFSSHKPDEWRNLWLSPSEQFDKVGHIVYTPLQFRPVGPPLVHLWAGSDREPPASETAGEDEILNGGGTGNAAHPSPVSRPDVNAKPSITNTSVSPKWSAPEDIIGPRGLVPTVPTALQAYMEKVRKAARGRLPVHRANAEYCIPSTQDHPAIFYMQKWLTSCDPSFEVGVGVCHSQS